MAASKNGYLLVFRFVTMWDGFELLCDLLGFQSRQAFVGFCTPSIYFISASKLQESVRSLHFTRSGVTSVLFTTLPCPIRVNLGAFCAF